LDFIIRRLRIIGQIWKVCKILVSYLDKEVERLNLADSQNMIWLIDCWSVHTTVAFRDWMSKNHPRILVLYVPANCTSKFQPADVVLQ
jgi:hypothetical protein